MDVRIYLACAPTFGAFAGVLLVLAYVVNVLLVAVV
jgi:hypothetical protein